MSISTRLDTYLKQHDIPFEAFYHNHSSSSIGSAFAAEIPINQVAKAVVIKDHEDRKVMAVLPANNKIILSILNEELHGSYHLLKEQEVYALFDDCEHGAIPPVGDIYNMTMVCDSLLDGLNNVYIEAGDHKTLLKINHQDFRTMMENGKHLRFSKDVFH